MKIEKILDTKIEGCKILIIHPYTDTRGSFFKIFNESLFKKLGLEYKFKEEFYSISQKNVLRGLHFQIPPFEQTKLINCINGKILDVFLDIRKNSPTYGKYDLLILEKNDGKILYLPPGIAHGFLSLEDNSIVYYKVSKEYSKDHDQGILWNSLDIPWPINDPIISERDKNFPKFENFQTPFKYYKK